MGISGKPSPEQLHSFHSQGFLVIESFSSSEEIDAMRRRMDQLLDGFDHSAAASIFSTKNQQQLTNDYFHESAEKISFFFEDTFNSEVEPTGKRVLFHFVVALAKITKVTDGRSVRKLYRPTFFRRAVAIEKAFGEDGSLKQPKQLSINKVGHALHEIDPVFKKFSCSEKLSNLMRSLGYKRPVIIQSMYIFKQPGIGGEVVPHQDNSFLYTEPPTCTGLWLALEDATILNGCLWAIPGSHKNGLVRRFFRGNEGVYFDRPSPPYNDKDFVPIEVKAGSLVVIHGDLIHQSFENQSPKSRHAYSLHVVDTDGCKWAPENWIRRKVDPEPLYES